MKIALSISHAVLFALVTIAFAVSSQAQAVCPTLSLNAPESVNESEPLVFRASVSNPPSNLKYYWILSRGTIKSGQGTAEIRIDTAGHGDNDVTATLELGGLPPACPSTRSITASVFKKYVPPAATRLHQYSAPWPKDETARIKRIAKFLSRTSNDEQIYIEHFAGSRSTVKAAEAERIRVRNLFAANGAPTERVFFIATGKAAKATFAYWLVPQGAMPPQSTTPAAVPTPVAKKVYTITAKDTESQDRNEKIVKELTGDPLATPFLVANMLANTPPAKIDSTRNAIDQSMKAIGFAADDYVVLVNKKARENSLEYWLVPLGAKPPSIASSKRTSKR